MIIHIYFRENLYEFGKYIRESGAKEYFTLPRLKKIMKQVNQFLNYFLIISNLIIIIQIIEKASLLFKKVFPFQKISKILFISQQEKNNKIFNI